MQTNTKVLTAHIPSQLVEKIDQLAVSLERSRTWVVKQALTEWVDQEENRRQMTLEALADLDAGRMVDHEKVKAWAGSLGTDNPLSTPF